MSSNSLMIFVIISLLISGCNKEINSKEASNKGSLTQQQSEETEHIEEQAYIELKPYDETETVKFNDEVGKFIPFSLQPFGVYVPEGLNKAFPDARVGTEFLSHVSVFMVPKLIENQIEQFMLSHVNTKGIIKADEFIGYSDYLGTVVELSGAMEKRFDFFLTNYKGVDVLVRIITNSNEEEKKELFWEITKTIRIMENEFTTVEAAQRLFSEDYSGLTAIEIDINSETHKATFVPFDRRNYGMFLPPFYKKLKFEDSFHIGLDNENKVYFIEVNTLDLRDIYTLRVPKPPVIFDQSLVKYEDYLGTFVDSLRGRYDFFLYKNGEQGAIVILNYQESENKNIQQSLLKVASTITPVQLEVIKDPFSENEIREKRKKINVDSSEDSILVYYPDLLESTKSILQPIRLKVPAHEDPIEFAVAKLMSGYPDLFLSCAFPEGTELLSIRNEDGIYYIDFSKEFVSNYIGGGNTIQGIQSSFAYTLMQFEQVKGIQFLIESKASLLPGEVDNQVFTIKDVETLFEINKPEQSRG